MSYMTPPGPLRNGVSKFKWRLFRLMLLFAFALCYISDVSESFNVEWRNAVKFHGPSQSLFGFSIAQHKENGKSCRLSDSILPQ
ncbi:hypothetical protein V9T40_014909 [Parthenolecanium corni]|uniref:Uncharacterized protein n=1 Tax=Parthenolecanium corni TaxID=536013 RepID=A0AAN9TKC6_9HEMI